MSNEITPPKLGMVENTLELFREEIEGLDMYLDELKAPNKDEDGAPYSIAGRIRHLILNQYRERLFYEFMELVRTSLVGRHPPCEIRLLAPLGEPNSFTAKISSPFPHGQEAELKVTVEIIDKTKKSCSG